MKDRLTKKRVKVDYGGIIKMLNLSDEFTNYLYSKRPIKLSLNRYALAFLKHKRVCIEWCHIFHSRDHINTYAELLKHCDYNLEILEDCCYELH